MLFENVENVRHRTNEIELVLSFYMNVTLVLLILNSEFAFIIV